MKKLVSVGVFCSLAVTASCGPSEADFMGAAVCPNTNMYITQGSLGGQQLEDMTVPGMSSATVQTTGESSHNIVDTSAAPIFQVKWQGTLMDGQIGIVTHAEVNIVSGIHAGKRLCAKSGLVRLGVVNGSGQYVLRNLSLSTGTCTGTEPAMSGEVKGCFR